MLLQPEISRLDNRDDSGAKRAQRIIKEKVIPPPAPVAPLKPPKNVSELLKKCHRILSQLQKHKYAGPFLLPVDYEALRIPDYPLIVKEPMDFSSVEKKLRSGSYASPQQFATDVRKIWANAFLYNPKTSPIYETTVVMSTYFESIYKGVDDTVPYMESVHEAITKKIVKVERKIDEVENKGVASENDRMDRPMNEKERKDLTQMIKSIIE